MIWGLNNNDEPVVGDFFYISTSLVVASHTMCDLARVMLDLSQFIVGCAIAVSEWLNYEPLQKQTRSSFSHALM